MQETIQKDLTFSAYTLFECNVCDRRFEWMLGRRVCPHCGNVDFEQLTAVYQRNCTLVEELMNHSEWHGG